MTKPSLLLHTCCATCSGFLVKSLTADYSVKVYYYNPNIHPVAEYIKRLNEAKKYFETQQIDFIMAPHDHGAWLAKVRGLELEPERGKRCKICYHDRLAATARVAKENGFKFFSSALSVSPHKDAKIIINLGRALAVKYGVEFLAGDWKKNDGFKQAMALSRSENFYRQNYCGCEFSVR